MKKHFLLISLLACFFCGYAQKQKADSLASLLAKENADTNKVNHMWKMASFLYSYAPDSAIIIAQKALFLARKIKYKEGESRSLGQMANGFLSLGNYPRALDYYLKKLQLEENGGNVFNLASATMNIGIVYVYREDYDKALYYLRRADSMVTVNNLDDLRYNTKLNLGDLYSRKHQKDSAFNYFSQSLKIAGKMQDGDFIGTSMIGIAHVYLQAGYYTNALGYYKGALPFLEAANDEDLICEATLGLAELYKAQNITDSANYFAHYSFVLAQRDGFQSRQLNAARFLSEQYSLLFARDSAFVYMKAAQELEDSVNSKEKIKESEVISITEQLRQNEIAESSKRLREERKQQLQLLLIGIFIPALFLVTLLLSRVKVHVQIIKFLGVISLLILFEYLTLLLHPMVLDLTHHTPFLELLIFVAIASLLIPGHHRLEHWLIKKLTVRRPGARDIKIHTRRLKIKGPK